MVTARMPISVPPISLREFSTTISTKPASASTGGHSLRLPSVTSVAGWSATMPDCWSAMMPRNRPTPAETASFRFCGIDVMMYSRSLVAVMISASTPEMNTKASACCQVYL